MINAVSCFILRFLLLLRPRRETLFDVISRHHSRATLKDVFNLISEEKKIVKCKLDVTFLHTCKSFEIFPKFLRFKLYKKSLRNSKLYLTWQNELLEREIDEKQNKLRELERSRKVKRSLLYERLTLFQYFLAHF